MTDRQSKGQKAFARRQEPNPKRSGFDTSGCILVDEKKRVAWQATWNRKYAGNWEERGGKLYPRESNA